MATLFLVLVLAQARELEKPFSLIRGHVDLGVVDELETDWLWSMLAAEDVDLESWGPSYPNRRPQVMTDGVGVTRWLDKTGEAWMHIEADQRSRLHGNVLFRTGKPKARRYYAAEFHQGKRHGWQYWARDNFVLATLYELDTPLSSYEIEGEGVTAVWFHDKDPAPNPGFAARFKEADEALEDCKDSIAECRKLVLAWIKADRQARRKALGPEKRAAIIGRDQDRRAADLESHMMDRLQHKRAQGLAP